MYWLGLLPMLVVAYFISPLFIITPQFYSVLFYGKFDQKSFDIAINLYKKAIILWIFCSLDQNCYKPVISNSAKFSFRAQCSHQICLHFRNFFWGQIIVRFSTELSFSLPGLRNHHFLGICTYVVEMCCFVVCHIISKKWLDYDFTSTTSWWLKSYYKRWFLFSDTSQIEVGSSKIS